MRDFRKDFKALIETVTSVNVYPVNVPDNVSYPVIEMKISGGRRNGDSSMTESQIRDYRVSCIILSDAQSADQRYDIEELLETLDLTQLTTASTDTMMIYLDNSVELFNYVQNLNEITVDFRVKKLN